MSRHPIARVVVILFAGMLLLVGCAGPLLLATGSPAQEFLSTPTLAAPVFDLVAVGSDPATETPTPAPTVDLEAINAKLAAKDAELQSAINAKLAAQAEQQNAVATSQAANAIALMATVTLGAQEVEKAGINATAQAVAATSQAVVATENEAGRVQHNLDGTATAEAPAAALRATEQAAQAERAPLRATVDALTPLIYAAFIAGSILILAWKDWRRRNQPAPPEAVDENLLEGVPVQIKAPIRAWERTGETTINRDTEPPCASGKFHDLLAHHAVGGYLGINTVVSAHIFGSNDEYAPVLAWLSKHHYVVTVNGGKRLSGAGEQFASEWLVLHPLPIVENVQNRPPSGHADDNHAHDSGGGG